MPWTGTRKPASRSGPAAGPRSGLRPSALLVVAGTALGLVLVAAAVRPPWQLEGPRFSRSPAPARPVPPVAVPPPAPRGSATPRPSPEPFPPLPWLKWVLLALAVVVLVFLVARWLRRLAPVPERLVDPDDLVQVVPELPVLQRGAEEAERHLIAGGNPTDAIVAAWMALEEAAQSSGVRRRPAQTPTEFTADVLSTTGVDPGAVQTLLRLYLRARFAADGAGPADLESARQCVRTLAAGWRGFAGHSLEQDSTGSGRADDGEGDR